jgi:hypothetical protein
VEECQEKTLDIFLKLGGNFTLKRWLQREQSMTMDSRAGRLLTLAANANKEKDKGLLRGECP